jgi:hypothetical protein
MIQTATLIASLLMAPAADSLPRPASLPSTVAEPDTTPAPDSGARSAAERLLPPLAVADTTTPRRRPRAVEVSDAYEVRLRIHRYASYSMIPLFALQSIAGNQLYQSGGPRPTWADNLHKAGAAGLGALFTVNTVTGLWNLWDSRAATEGRGKRWLHSGLMLASDAGFAYAGVKLSQDAKRSQTKRDEHRRVAYISMGTALAGYATMLIGEH